MIRIDHRTTAPFFAAFLLTLATSSSHAADSVSSQFYEWTKDHTVQRKMTLQDLGIKQALILSGQSSQREVYLPVPTGIAFQNAQLQLDGRYVRGHAGRTSVLWSVDDDPSAARQIADAEGDASQLVAIDGTPRESGFVRINVGWWSVVSDIECADQSAPANVLRLDPNSTFSYQFDAHAVDTVTKAWGALPPKVRLLIPSNALQPQAFDAAWRIGTTLRNGGKQVTVVALPSVGSKVNLTGIVIPSSLTSIPAYAALASAGPTYQIKNLAEVGALLSLRDSSPLAADVVIDNDQMRKSSTAALDALAAQVAASGNDAGNAFSSWRNADMSALEKGISKDAIRVASLAGRPALFVNEATAAKVAGLLGEQWRSYALGRNLQVAKAQSPAVNNESVLLSRFGNMAGTMDVVTRADRSAVFDLAALSTEGRLPEEVVINVSASPNAGDQGAIATIFFNDYLLGADILRKDGKPQRLVAKIPTYALAARNEVRVSFLRQPARPYCHDPATAYPVSILPSSHLTLSKRSLGTNFIAAASALAHANEVFVPQEWLQDAPRTLAKVMGIASAVGVAPESANFKVAASGSNINPSQPYLAFGVTPSGITPAATKNGQLIISGKQQTWLNATGLSQAGVAQVVETSGHLGVLYNDLDAQGPALDQPLRLLRGDIAVLDGSGNVKTFDQNDPFGTLIANADNPLPWWKQQMVWLWIIVLAVLSALLLARVTQVRRRRQASQQKH